MVKMYVVLPFWGYDRLYALWIPSLAEREWLRHSFVVELAHHEPI